ncbi:MAG: UPF0104 family protein [Anaerolineales bacterium]|nr:UPF0104 family protein [Anaerolineales bacterium]
MIFHPRLLHNGPIRKPRALLRALTRSARYLLPLILLGLAVHLILPRLATIEQSLGVIRQMAWWAVALAVLAQLLSYLGSGYLLRALVAIAGQRLSVVRGTLIFTAASSVGLSGGGPLGNFTVTYRWLRGSRVSAEGAMLAGSLPNVFYDSIMAATGIFGLLHLLIVHELTLLQVVGFGFTLLMLSLIAGVALWGVHHRPRLTTLAVRVAERWAVLRHRPYDPAATETAIGRWFSALDALRAGGWRGPTLGAILNTGFDMLTLYLLFVAAGHKVSPGVMLAGYGLPLLLGKVAIWPGGIGLVEATMAALYDGLGVPHGVTVVVIIAYRFLSFWLPLLVGLPLIPYLQHVCGSESDESGVTA